MTASALSPSRRIPEPFRRVVSGLQVASVGPLPIDLTSLGRNLGQLAMGAPGFGARFESLHCQLASHNS
jgi:hypothetical protein